ncbi:MAG: nucleotidyltransferase domain-containing protein [Prochlorococcaceae cyanobacterium]
MPVRSLTQSLLRWPEPQQVLTQVVDWAAKVAPDHPGLQRLAVFGSYGRGDAGVGSDLDLLLIDGQATGPQHQRLLEWPLAELPLSCDALVLTPAEHQALLADGSAMAAALARDSRWLWYRV